MAVDQFEPEIACSLLSNTRRRYLLDRLRESAVRTTEDLAVEIAACEEDVAVDAVDDDHRERVHISLVHNHLPRLVDHGVVEWDPRSGDVVRDDGFAALESFVDAFAPGAQTMVDVTPS